MKTQLNGAGKNFANFLREDHFAFSFANSPQGRAKLQHCEDISEELKNEVLELWGESTTIEDRATFTPPEGVSPCDMQELLYQLRNKNNATA